MKKVMIVFALVVGLGFFGVIPQGNAQMGPGMMGQGGYGTMGPAPTGQGSSGQWNYCPYCGRPLPRGGYGMGPGMMGQGGYGMMGRGGYGMGYGMMGQGGYGMMGPGMMGRGGYGMMGPGMMGRGGYGSGYGPGMMGRGGYGMMGPGTGQSYGPQYQGKQKPLTEKDAKGILENYLKARRNPNLKLGKIKTRIMPLKRQLLRKRKEPWWTRSPSTNKRAGCARFINGWSVSPAFHQWGALDF